MNVVVNMHVKLTFLHIAASIYRDIQHTGLIAVVCLTVVEFARQLALAHELFADQLRQAAQQLADDRYANLTKRCHANNLVT